MVAIAVGPLERLIGTIFERAGCPSDEAGRIALYLTRANLCGHDSHGVIRVPRYVDWMAQGWLKPGQHVRVLHDAGSIVLVDGQNGFGQTVGPETAAIGIERARGHGLAVTALRKSGHLGRIGDFAEMGVEAGLVSLHFVNVHGSILVAPFGAAERRFSTNPIAIGVPTGDDAPFVLDFATSYVAEGKVLVAMQGGKPVPKGALVTAEGELTDDPSVMYGTGGAYPDPRLGSGAMRTFGEHKGSGLALACDLLAGCLGGSGYEPTQQKSIHNGMLSIWLDPAKFRQDDGLASEVRAYVEHIRGARPTTSGEEVLVPGDKERRMKAERTREGVPLPEDTWKAILGAAERTGLTHDEIDAIVGGQR